MADSADITEVGALETFTEIAGRFGIADNKTFETCFSESVDDGLEMASVVGGRDAIEEVVVADGEVDSFDL